MKLRRHDPIDRSPDPAAQLATRFNEPWTPPRVNQYRAIGRFRFPADGSFAPVEGIDLSRFPMRIDVLSKRDYASGLELGLRLRVRDRDNPDHWTWTMLTVHVGDSVIAEGEEAVDMVVHRFVRETVLHELDECYLLGGARVHDPHADEEPEPEATLSELYTAALRADDAWRDELARIFGARAGDERYTKKGRGAPGTELRKRHDAWVAADHAWEAAKGRAR